MKLIVGLGNPGRQYAGTRHNIGFEVIAQLYLRGSGGREWLRDAKTRHTALVGEIQVQRAGGGQSAGDPASDGEADRGAAVTSEPVLLATPMTYMNNSGRSVGPLVSDYGLSPADVLVICDDKDLDCGRLRLRKSGSAGGQKGLKDIIDRLQTPDVARLRVGVGQPPQGVDTADYVLSPFRISERQRMDEAVLDAAEGAETWAAAGCEAAMNRVNAPRT